MKILLIIFLIVREAQKNDNSNKMFQLWKTGCPFVGDVQRASWERRASQDSAGRPWLKEILLPRIVHRSH